MAKKESVRNMFDSIAPSYDRLNHILSLDVDKSWRRRAVREAVDCRKPLRVLDVACGTGDLTVALAKRMTKKCGDGKVEGIDLSENMMEIGRKKVAAAKVDGIVELKKGDGENLPYGDKVFDRATIAFGIRNFEHIDLGLSEMRRVLKPGGKAVILELSMPRGRLVARLYRFYFTKILPAIGGRASGDKASYNYLPASVLHFPAPDAFCSMMRDAGFTDIVHKPLTFGICRMFTGYRRD